MVTFFQFVHGIRAIPLNITNMTKFVIESHSPYYLHPSKGPDVPIIVVIFDEKTYDLWGTAIRNGTKGQEQTWIH